MCVLPVIQFVYGSTTGHSEFVCQAVISFLEAKKKPFIYQLLRAETYTASQLDNASIVVLASGTWNTGGIEGQLNPHMLRLLTGELKDVIATNTPMTAIALGDDRYFYTCNAALHLENYIISHVGKMFLPALRIVNEPYHQLDTIHAWADDFLKRATVFLKKRAT